MTDLILLSWAEYETTFTGAGRPFAKRAVTGGVWL
jgi:hypothetical protein